MVTGNARVTGILTVGTSSIILNDGTDTIKVGSQNLHSAGFEVNQINASGIITASTFIGALTGNVTGMLLEMLLEMLMDWLELQILVLKI